jgi:hypothetical protein
MAKLQLKRWEELDLLSRWYVARRRVRSSIKYDALGDVERNAEAVYQSNQFS